MLAFLCLWGLRRCGKVCVLLSVWPLERGLLASGEGGGGVVVRRMEMWLCLAILCLRHGGGEAEIIP